MSHAAALQAPSEDTGKTGLWLFLVSEVMLFGGFIAAYVNMRWGSEVCALGAPAWPADTYRPGLALASANTVLLLTSSYTMVRSLLAARAGDRQAFRRDLGLTLLLGAAFLALKSVEYGIKYHHGLFPGGEVVAAQPGLGIFVSFYFAMTGLHALHMIAGLVWNGLLWAAAPAALDERFGRKVELAGLYWHFVDVVWVFLFPLFYLI